MKPERRRGAPATKLGPLRTSKTFRRRNFIVRQMTTRKEQQQKPLKKKRQNDANGDAESDLTG